MSAGAAVSSEGLIREGSAPKLTHCCWKDSVPHGLLRRWLPAPCHVDLFTGSSQYNFIRGRGRDRDLEVSIFCNQSLEMTSHHLCFILLLEVSHKVLPTLKEEGLHRVWIPRDEDHRGCLGVCPLTFPFLVYDSVVQAPGGGVLLDSPLSVILSMRPSVLTSFAPTDSVGLRCSNPAHFKERTDCTTDPCRALGGHL